MSPAILARKYAEEVVRTVATIMNDKRAPAAARVNAAKKILNWAYGPVPNHPIDILTPPSEIPEFPTLEEVNAEIKRRGLLPLFARIAEEMNRDGSDDQETKT